MIPFALGVIIGILLAIYNKLVFTIPTLPGKFFGSKQASIIDPEDALDKISL